VPLQPNDTIGIIGGGQLGRMLAMAAAKMGFRIVILDPQENAPAFQCATVSLCASYDDRDALNKLVDMADVITYEFENVDLSALREIGKTASCHPNPNALETSQDRLVEKDFFNKLDIATAPYFEVGSRQDLEKALVKSDGKGILKTRRFGYDGKGQVRLSPDKADSGIEDACNVLQDTPCILEGFVNFDREISIIAARGTDASIVCFYINCTCQYGSADGRRCAFGSRKSAQ